MKNPTEELLHHIYISARSGCEAINGMLPKITDPALRTETTAQMDMYCALSTRAEQLLQDKDLGEVSFPLTSRLAVRSGVILETMGSPAQTELARILRQSSRESAGQMRSAVTECGGSGCDPDALALGQRMMAFEMAETERLGALPLA